MTELLLAALPLLAGALVWLWKKWGAKIALIKELVEDLKDGELTEEEAKRIVEEIKKLFAKGK